MKNENIENFLSNLPIDELISEQDIKEMYEQCDAIRKLKDEESGRKLENDMWNQHYLQIEEESYFHSI